ncbi:hypothetical protein AVEN_57001-1 [Araneus ventricosus]|uniref:Odorant receptor n=1 Tax=Araneus ventricosus TaxID=182803 RepID=A0A4Y2N346_ARAVE|nr:hypothetical protein AVEN_45256-1 [Araneus ventricosus]GBN33312.1 hypothetical protein AVEN_57001-1 [Araneus ventricosus]
MILGSAAVAVIGGVHPEVIFTFYGVNLLTLALWRAIYRRKNSIRKLFIKCDKICSIFQKQVNDISGVVNTCLIVSAVVTVLTASGCAIVLPISPPPYRMYYTFFLPLEEGTVSCLLTRHVATLLSFVTMYFIPNLVSVLGWAVYYMCSCISGMLSEELRDLHRKITHPDEISRLVHKHYLLLQLIQDVENELSSVSFLLLCSQMLNMYKALAIYIAVSNSIIFTALFWDCLPPVTLVPVSLVGIIWYASRISFHLSNIQASLQLSYNALLDKDYLPWKMKNLLLAMLETEFPKITSGGMLELKPVLIFSVFGSLFTYGLLIRSVNKE